MRVVRVYVQVFLVIAVSTGLAAGTAMGLWFVVLDDGTFGRGLAVGLVTGLMCGVAVSALAGRRQVLAFQDAPEGSSLSPRQTRCLTVVNGPCLADRIVAALRSLPAEITAVDVPAGRYVARHGGRWGEDVTVQLSGDPAHPVATVSSRPRGRSTVIDYGRGRRNVEHVVAALPTAQQVQP